MEDYAADLGALSAAWPGVDVELPRLLRAVLARGSWTDEHHVAVVVDGALRVRHRPQVVDQARKLVESLRARLLVPLQIQVGFIEVETRSAGKVLGSRGRWDTGAFRAAVERGQARTLARVVLAGYNGQWVLADRVSNQVFLSGVNVSEGAITPRSTTLASGFTVQAAAWRWGAARAVVALTGLYTGAARGGQKVKQKVHRQLPSEKTYERHWEAHIEFQDQLTITRGEWTVAGVLPRDTERVCAVVLRVDWQSPLPDLPRIKTFAPDGFGLDVIEVALPIDTRGAPRVLDMDNRRELDSSSVAWFKSRAKSYQEQKKKNIYNFQAESGNVDLSLSSQRSFSKSAAQFQSRGGRESGGESCRRRWRSCRWR